MLCKSTETNAEKLRLLALMGISDDIEVVVILEINQKDDRSQCISVKFDRVCRAKKYVAHSVFCSVVFCYFLV